MCLVLAAAGCARPDGWPPPGGSRPTVAPGEPPGIEIEHPPPGAAFPSGQPVYVAGRAWAPGGPASRFDIAFVIDTSASTGVPATGAPPDPRVPTRGPAPKDSVLAAEVAAAQVLLGAVDPRRTRVAVVSFAGETENINLSSGPPPRVHDEARTWMPLGRDAVAFALVLDALLKEGAWGMTHMAAGLRRATAELVGGPDALSEADPSANWVIVFLSDGVPTLPHPQDQRRNERAAIREAERAGAYGIVIHSYGIGEEALKGPLALVEMAERTGGTFTPVRDPRDLAAVVAGLELVGIQAIEVRNLTTGRPADSLLRHADGSWDALVRLAPGRNEIEALARTTDGRESRTSLWLERREDAAAIPIPADLVLRRGRVLDDTLQRLREQRRMELLGQIVREREQAARRAAEQRRELELEGSDEDP